MDTKIFEVTSFEELNDNADIKEAARILREGGLVAFPTETVYGLGGNALNEESARHIYEAKGRPSDNPLIVHVSSIEEAKPLIEEMSEQAQAIAEKYWPGPLTMIFKKSAVVPRTTTGGLDTVAIRMPNHPVASALIKEAGVPVAAPSANMSGRPSPTCAEHVIEDLSGRIDAIINAGWAEIGLESTILDMTGEIPVILRPGFISERMIKEVTGQVMRDPTLDKKPTQTHRPKAPGMLYRHYAPKGDLTVIEGDIDKVISTINAFITNYNSNEVGVITATSCLY